jgi:hypothetical protein
MAIQRSSEGSEEIAVKQSCCQYLVIVDYVTACALNMAISSLWMSRAESAFLVSSSHINHRSIGLDVQAYCHI